MIGAIYGDIVGSFFDFNMVALRDDDGTLIGY